MSIRERTNCDINKWISQVCGQLEFSFSSSFQRSWLFQEASQWQTEDNCMFILQCRAVWWSITYRVQCKALRHKWEVILWSMEGIEEVELDIGNFVPIMLRSKEMSAFVCSIKRHKIEMVMKRTRWRMQIIELSGPLLLV